ncbi:pyridoxal phosphate-dependent transferase [Lentinula aff. detonsa]|uniref:Pyridoxal phosphate-dependent transferase n=1 Tax=Lentinula aff. detonsa TaxID=2804958 RepID=A0AA38NBR1_9AGAR|nr:pyridoxal phosphate-dependent transferase [Lentinula aff. detonsa]
MTSVLYDALEKQVKLRELEAGYPTPSLRTAVPPSAIDFFSNDYLSFTSNPIMRQKFLRRLSTGHDILGSRASRHGAGNNIQHVELEQRLLKFFRGPSALLFASGVDANIGLWGTLPQPGDVVFHDHLVHASIHDGLRGCRNRPTITGFKHNDVMDLRQKIKNLIQVRPDVAEGKHTVFVLVDALYSMNGDFAPLQSISQAVKELLPPGVGYIFSDEAHSVGIVGEGGRGLVSELNLEHSIELRLYTFSKSFGTFGAVIICPEFVRRFMIANCRTFIFTTAVPHFALIAMNASVDMLESHGKEVMELEQQNIKYAQEKLTGVCRAAPSQLIRLPSFNDAATTIHGKSSPIVPIFTTKSHSLCSHLSNHGYIALPYRYPVVPKGMDRVRLSIHAGNSIAQIDELGEVLREWIKGQGINEGDNATVSAKL